MKPYYERGGIRIFHGDAREVLIDLSVQREHFESVITDPVWPGAKIVRLAGFGEAAKLFEEVACSAASLAERLVVYLSRETDPRFLQGVPLSLPFLCTCWLRFLVPRPVGRVLRGANVAYAFGTFPRPKKGQRVIPGASSPHDPDADMLEGSDKFDGRRPPRKRHPCPMQLGHAKWLVRWFGGTSVLDPFCGSGQMLLAAKEHGIPATGIEVEERYCELSALQLEQDVLFPPASFVALDASDRSGDDKAALAEPQERRAP